MFAFRTGCAVAYPGDTGGLLHHEVKTTHREDTVAAAVAKPFPFQ